MVVTHVLGSLKHKSIYCQGIAAIVYLSVNCSMPFRVCLLHDLHDLHVLCKFPQADVNSDLE